MGIFTFLLVLSPFVLMLVLSRLAFLILVGADLIHFFVGMSGSGFYPTAAGCHGADSCLVSCSLDALIFLAHSSLKTVILVSMCSLGLDHTLCVCM